MWCGPRQRSTVDRRPRTVRKHSPQTAVRVPVDHKTAGPPMCDSTGWLFAAPYRGLCLTAVCHPPRPPDHARNPRSTSPFFRREPHQAGRCRSLRRTSCTGCCCGRVRRGRAADSRRCLVRCSVRALTAARGSAACCCCYLDRCASVLLIVELWTVPGACWGGFRGTVRVTSGVSPACDDTV